MAELEALSAVGAGLVGIGAVINLAEAGNVAGAALIGFGLLLWGVCTLATKFVNAK